MRAARRYGLGPLLAALAATAIASTSSAALLTYLTFGAYYLVLAGSWNFLAGYGGQFSFAHIGLSALGAYMSIWINQDAHIGIWLTMALTGFGVAAVGACLGIITVRVTGFYLALITFAFAEAFVVWATGDQHLTGGPTGRQANFLFNGISQKPYAWLGFAIVCAYFATQEIFLRSRAGLQATALRDREEIAEGLGVRTRRVKVFLFALTSFWAGVAGAFYAGVIGLVEPSVGDLTNMGLLVAMVVIGGMGRRYGPVLGVIVLQVITYYVSGSAAEYTTLIFSGIVVAIMVFARGDLAAAFELALARLRPPTPRWDNAATPKADSTP